MGFSPRCRTFWYHSWQLAYRTQRPLKGATCKALSRSRIHLWRFLPEPQQFKVARQFVQYLGNVGSKFNLHSYVVRTVASLLFRTRPPPFCGSGKQGTFAPPSRHCSTCPPKNVEMGAVRLNEHMRKYARISICQGGRKDRCLRRRRPGEWRSRRRQGSRLILRCRRTATYRKRRAGRETLGRHALYMLSLSESWSSVSMLLGVPERALAIFDPSSLMSAIEVTIADEDVGSF